MQKKFTQQFLFLIMIFQGLTSIQAKSHKYVFESYSNFHNPKKWSDGKLPCAGDVISFSQDAVVSVFVQTNTTITEIVLPTNGEFIFDDLVTWGLSRELSDCSSTSGRTATFDSSPDDWFDGNNWGVYDGDESATLDVLDTEKVPCDFDDIVFPSKNSWTVFIPFDFKSTSLSIWEKSYTANDFSLYRSSGYGRFQFQGVGTVASIGQRCNGNTGCVCRSASNAQTIETAICNHVTCSNDQCEEPFSAYGQCCKTCGALLTMFFSPGIYTENKLIQQIDRVKDSNSKYVNVHYALSKIKASSSSQAAARTDQEYIQILLRDEETGSQHGSVAQEFSRELSNILKSTEDLGVSNVTKTESGKGVAQSSTSAGAIAGIVIGVICAVVLLVVAAIYLSKKFDLRSIGFSHKRMKEEQENFDNPLYDMGYNGVENVEKIPEKDSGKSSSITGIPQASALSSDFGMSFGNPLYQEEDV